MSASDPFDRLSAGEIPIIVVEADGEIHTHPPKNAVILSGSFNPLHVGHERLLAAAYRITGREPVYELSITNVDKPPIPKEVIVNRLAQFKGRATLVLTRAPTFVQKSELLPGSGFAIGYDTAIRLFPERYYPPYDPAKDPTHAGSAVALAMNTLRRNRCSFIVAGRVDADGRFRTIADIEVPSHYRDLLVQIPEADFRADISSTDLRSKGFGMSS
ncbi:MAG: hypothetical protein EXR57_05615 [Dehalococcoidia bacterium]|nr:hypothetical protein [Dehalococcoidia bacterium]MSQ35276.1 hypothetical protein [Dehalococcoidia bacterium]